VGLPRLVRLPLLATENIRIRSGDCDNTASRCPFGLKSIEVSSLVNDLNPRTARPVFPTAYVCTPRKVDTASSVPAELKSIAVGPSATARGVPRAVRLPVEETENSSTVSLVTTPRSVFPGCFVNCTALGSFPTPVGPTIVRAPVAWFTLNIVISSLK
jgi:hypothetical protein